MFALATLSVQGPFLLGPLQSKHLTNCQGDNKQNTASARWPLQLWASDYPCLLPDPSLLCPTMLWSTLWALLVIAHSPLPSSAQNCSPGYEWANNQRGQSVCQIMDQAPRALGFRAPMGDAVFNPPNRDNESPGYCSGAYWLLLLNVDKQLSFQVSTSVGDTILNPPTFALTEDQRPPNQGLRDFQLPQWIDQHSNEFINRDRYDPTLAGGPARPPQPPPDPGTGSTTPTPPPSEEVPNPPQETQPPNTNTDDASPSSSPGSITQPVTTGEADQASSTTSFTGSSSLSSESSASGSATSVRSGTDTNSLQSTTILTTFITTDASGQETTVTSAMPTLVDPSGSGFGDSPDPGTTSAQSNRNNIGAIVGGVIGGLALLVLVVVVLLVVRRRRRNARIAPSTAFIKEYNKEFERYEDETTRTASPRPFSPAGSRARSVATPNNLSFVVESSSQDQLLETMREREPEHYREDSIRGHAATESLLDGRQSRA
ncbi:hypothetical protein NMY22_g5197 [Coprinellus aureogranulatus]|nr:hypothetical protein NMY22_g5197 [Coprinellus aureogranulatus]